MHSINHPIRSHTLISHPNFPQLLQSNAETLVQLYRKGRLFLLFSNNPHMRTNSISNHTFFNIQINHNAQPHLNQNFLTSTLSLLPLSSSPSRNMKSLVIGGAKIASLQFKNRQWFLLAFSIHFSQDASSEVSNHSATARMSICLLLHWEEALRCVQWCLINHFYLARTTMYNSFPMTCQPYYLVQMPQSSYPQFVMQEGSQFLLPQFLPFIIPKNEVQGIPIGLKSEGNTSAGVSEPNEAKEPTRSRAVQKITQGSHVIKEKIIKKPANRPATYLTERKYYLAQTIEEEPNASRRLRPRIFKKRTMKVLGRQLCSKNEEGKELQQVHSVHKEAGSSELQASQTKKGNSGIEEIAEEGTIPPCESTNNQKEGKVESCEQ